MTFDLVRIASGVSGGGPCLRLVAEAMVVTRFVVSLSGPEESLEDSMPPSLLDMIKAFFLRTKTRSESWVEVGGTIVLRSWRMIDTWRSGTSFNAQGARGSLISVSGLAAPWYY